MNSTEQRLDQRELVVEDENVVAKLGAGAVVNVYRALLESVRDLADRAGRLAQKPA